MCKNINHLIIYNLQLIALFKLNFIHIYSIDYLICIETVIIDTSAKK